MSRWWRAYDEAVDDPKLILLGDKAHRAWFNLMCVASLHEGVLPDIKIVAVKLRLTPQRAAAALTELVKAGLFDQREDGRFEPHNWNGRQYKTDVTDPTAATRAKNYRDRKRDAHRDATVTEGVTVTDTREQKTEADTEKKEHCPEPKSVRTKQVYSEEFEIKFWQPYPRSPTMSKSEAWKSWLKLTPEQRTASCQAIEPYRRFLKTKPNLETVHACRFLSQQRFEGFLGGAQPQILDIRSSLV